MLLWTVTLQALHWISLMHNFVFSLRYDFVRTLRSRIDELLGPHIDMKLESLSGESDSNSLLSQIADEIQSSQEYVLTALEQFSYDCEKIMAQTAPCRDSASVRFCVGAMSGLLYNCAMCQVLWLFTHTKSVCFPCMFSSFREMFKTNNISDELWWIERKH